jgi:hypothetical protein
LTIENRVIRSKIGKHIKNTRLKGVDASVGIKPVLRDWVESH